MRAQRYLIYFFCVLVWSFVSAESAKAQGIAGAGTTKEEMALLPKYCPHAGLYHPIYGTPEGHAYWMQRLGDDFRHIHHYCWALVALQRAGRAQVSARQRQHWLASAENDITYVLRNSSQKLVLIPELLLRRGQVRVRLNKYNEASEDFQRAIKVRPDYWPPYVELAEILKTRKDMAGARRVLEEGLKHSPDSRGLQRALEHLGSK